MSQEILSAHDMQILQSLDKPGAGIPRLHQLLLRHFVSPFVASRSDWDRDSHFFHQIKAQIFGLAEGLDEISLMQRVLVPSQRGLEDSSRYWSLAMTFDHLEIVGRGMQQLIVALSRGIVPDRNVDTAAVKPELNDVAAIEKYRSFAAGVIPEIDAAVVDRQSSAVLPHPWFGPFTAHQWHWLLAQHAKIHLQQMQTIKKSLKH